MGDPKSQIVRDAVRRFPNYGNRTIARILCEDKVTGPLFDNDLERIRLAVRRIRGVQGNKAREDTTDKSCFIDKPLPLPATWRKVRTSHHLNPGLWLIIQDIHVPFHERKPIEAAVKYGQDQRVNGLLINGDLQDLASVGFWRTAKRDFQFEMEMTADMLDFLRQEFPNMDFVYKPGNHELRLPSYYMVHAPEPGRSALGCMEHALGFEEREIEFLDYHQKVMAGKLPVFHGHELRGLSRVVNPARGLFLKAKTWAACGHFHSTSMHTTSDVNDTTLTTWSFGCLCDLHPDWNPWGNDWNWGFAIIKVEKNGFFEVENRRILNNGKVV